MIDENTIYDIYKKFGVEKTDVIIEEFSKIIEDDNTSNIIKSKACCGIGNLIIFLDPDYYDDAGYGYYKKALEYDEYNLDARLGICLVYDSYPEPDNSILTERECLENLDVLCDKFDEIRDESKKKTIIQLLMNLVKYRLKKIKRGL